MVKLFFLKSSLDLAFKFRTSRIARMNLRQCWNKIAWQKEIFWAKLPADVIGHLEAF